MLEVLVVSKRSPRRQQELVNQGWAVADVTSASAHPGHVRFSPFYPLGALVLPQGDTTESVEGGWQGLKVFEREGADASRFSVTSMKGLKRAANAKRGAVIGHAHEGGVIGYLDARKLIYLPLYRQALARLGDELKALEALAEAHGGRIALLDYETNGDVDDPRRPLSHA